MISRGEIKKCGFKPIKSRTPKLKTYELIRGGVRYRLEYLDEDLGEVRITKDAGKTAGYSGSILFHGFLPSRYELLIILRCLKIA